MSDALVSVSQAAELLGVHRNTIFKHIKKGKYTTVLAHGQHGAQHYIPRWQIDGLPQPDDWDPSTFTGIELAASPEPNALAPVEPARDLAPFLTLHEQLIADLRALERQAGELTARNAALDAINADLRAELDKLRAELIAARAARPGRSWRAKLFGTEGMP